MACSPSVPVRGEDASPNSSGTRVWVRRESVWLSPHFPAGAFGASLKGRSSGHSLRVCIHTERTEVERMIPAVSRIPAPRRRRIR